MSKTVREIKEWLLKPGINKVILVETQNEMYFSTKPYISETGINYIPCIKGGVSFTETLSFTSSPSTTYGDLELDNSGGDLDYLINYNKPWKNASIKMYLGDVSWPREDFAIIFSGVINNILIKGRNSINLSIGNLLSRLNVPVSEKVIQNEKGNPQNLTAELIGTDSYTAQTPIIEGLEDQLIPVLVGECFNVTPKLVSESYLVYNDWVADYLPDGQVFLLNDAPIEGIIEVRDNGAPLTKGEQWDQIGDRSFALFTSSYGTITCSAQGYKGSAAAVGYIGSEGSYAETIASVIKVFLTQYGGENRLDESEILFPTPDTTPYTGYYCTSRENVLDVCNKLAAAGGYQLIATTVTVTDEDSPPVEGKIRLLKLEAPNYINTGFLSSIPTEHDATTYLNRSKTFVYNGSIQEWTVPPSVTIIHALVKGASGGDVAPDAIRRRKTGNPGGGGGEISSWIPVTPGQTLKIIVGGRGSSGIMYYGAAGGGGYSAILDSSDNWLISAGGGGGSSGYTSVPVVSSGDDSIAGGHTLIVGSSISQAGGPGGWSNSYQGSQQGEQGTNGYSGSATSAGGVPSTLSDLRSTGGGGGSYSLTPGVSTAYINDEEVYGGAGGWPGGGAGGHGYVLGTFSNKALGGGGGGGGYIGGQGGNNDSVDSNTYGIWCPGQGGWNYILNNDSDRRVESNTGPTYTFPKDGLITIKWNVPSSPTDYTNDDIPIVLGGTAGYVYDYEMISKSLAVTEVMPPQYSFNMGYCKNWTLHDKANLAEGLVPQSVPLFTSDYLDYKVVDSTNYVGSNAWLAYLSKVPPRVDSLLNNYAQAKEVTTRMRSIWSTQRYLVTFTLLPHHLFLQLGNKIGLKLEHTNRYSFLNDRIGIIVQLQRNWVSGLITVGVFL